jgi:hypothetical protein
MYSSQKGLVLQNMILIITTKTPEDTIPVVKQLEFLGYKPTKIEPRIGLITLDTNPLNKVDLEKIEGVKSVENMNVKVNKFKAKVRTGYHRDNRYNSWKPGFRANMKKK